MNKAEEDGGRLDAMQEYLADYAGRLAYENLPQAVVRAAKLRIIDTLGVLIAGFDGEPCRIARKLAAEISHQDGATILGTATKVPVEMAAFANGTTARFAELTDMYHWPGSAYGHPSDVVAPLVTVAESVRASGRDLVTAVVLGYEIFCRYSDVFPNRGFDPSNFACIATAAAAGKLLQLDHGQLSHCLAMAATANVILRQVRVDHLSMYKVAAAGHAARAAVFAARLAKAGMEGPHLPFEGTSGWCRYVAGSKLTFTAFGGDSSDFKIPSTQLKFRPCAGNTISSVLAAEKLGPLRDGDDITEVLVEVYDRARLASASAPHFWDPQSAETADHSIPYLVAVALTDGSVSRRSFDDVHLHDPRIRNLMRKIAVVENEEFTKAYGNVPQAHRTRVTVSLRSGEKQIAESGGDAEDPAAPVSEAQINTKFRTLTQEALSPRRTDEALELLWRLEEVRDVSVLAPMLSHG